MCVYVHVYVCVYEVTYIFFPAFFKKHNVDTMSLQALFDFITDPTVNDNNMDEYLDVRIQDTNMENNPQQQVEEAVFKHAYIPQRLAQVLSITIYKWTYAISKRNIC